MKNIDVNKLIDTAGDILLSRHKTTFDMCEASEMHEAIAEAVMLAIAPDWKKSEDERSKSRQAMYISAEYLLGRQVFNNLYCAGILDKVKDMLSSKGCDLYAMEDIEDQALGNGGLGRLAACYLDSAATHAIPLTGYGLRYKYGLFRQMFENGYQKEIPDDWGAEFDPWSVRREELA
ncbi:MAG: glycogen/starch/alpha-glucan phosphorylase, partial [Clostridia bacterium]|nr:glycogen/starch/alpha-glucan phosphorylase [Clostridia bacterium]